SGVYLGWTVYNSAGTKVTSGSCGYYSLGTLPADSYTLVFTAGGASGTYNINIEQPQSFAVTLPLAITTNAVNGVTTQGAGDFEDAASRDIYTFSVPSGGESLLMDVSACPSSGVYLGWTLYNSAGTKVMTGSCGYYSLGTLAADTYTLVFSSGGAAGPYTVNIEPPQSFAASLPLVVAASTINGATATGAGTFETKASQDIYSFTVPTGGESLRMNVSSCPSSGIYLGWTLYNSSGAKVTSGSCSYYSLGTLAAGAYTLVFSAGGASGTYAINIEPPQTFTATLPLTLTPNTINGSTATGAGTFETKASQDIYSFTV